jgi:hypothetical protein
MDFIGMVSTRRPAGSGGVDLASSAWCAEV